MKANEVGKVVCNEEGIIQWSVFICGPLMSQMQSDGMCDQCFETLHAPTRSEPILPKTQT